jgi:hypothetical protein
MLILRYSVEHVKAELWRYPIFNATARAWIPKVHNTVPRFSTRCCGVYFSHRSRDV